MSRCINHLCENTTAGANQTRSIAAKCAERPFIRPARTSRRGFVVTTTTAVTPAVARAEPVRQHCSLRAADLVRGGVFCRSRLFVRACRRLAFRARVRVCCRRCVSQQTPEPLVFGLQKLILFFQRG